MMLDPDIEQEASLREAERYAELFDGWSDDLGVAEALTLVGTIRFWAGRCALAEEVLDKAAAHARRAGSRPQEGEIARLLTLVISQGPTPVVEAISRLQATLEGGVTDRKMQVAVDAKRAELEAMQGRFELARELVARATELAQEFGDQISLSRTLLDSARVEMLADSPETAERDARAGFEILDRMQSTGNLASAAPHLGDFLYAQGRYDEAEKTLGVQRTDHDRWRRRRRGALAAATREDARPAWSPRRSRGARAGCSPHRRSDRLSGPACRCPLRPRGGDAACGSKLRRCPSAPRCSRCVPPEGEPGRSGARRVVARRARLLSYRLTGRRRVASPRGRRRPASTPRSSCTRAGCDGRRSSARCTAGRRSPSS